MAEKTPREYGQTPIAKTAVVKPGGTKGQTPIPTVTPPKKT